jgi:hypothetical protein
MYIQDNYKSIKKKYLLHKEVEDINENAMQKTPMLEKVEKCHVGHPIFFVATL